jgi:hypothetical protein
MTGMTGGVPYYGGRFTPAQAYAAAHPSHPSHPANRVPPPAVTPAAHPPGPPPTDQLGALQHLLDTGVLTQKEFEELRARVEQ